MPPLKLPALDPTAVPETRGSGYPEPFRSRMGDRLKRRLGEACAACGTQNEPDEHFCGHCGAALSGTPAPTAGGAAAGRAPTEAERNLVAALEKHIKALETKVPKYDAHLER